MNSLPVGKIPHELLEQIINAAPTDGHRVKLGPGVGLDCAVLEFGDRCLVIKTEPITFASHEIGWYAVQIAANDIATMGARPQWMLLTALLPEKSTSVSLIQNITKQVADTCRALGITLIGGHTEVTHGLDRPILVTTLLAETECHSLITPKGARPGDRLIVTKGVPIEATALLAREFPQRLEGVLSNEEIKIAQDFIYSPGISVLTDAQIAVKAGKITAMHDPTEGGIATALWELAQACGHTLLVDLERIPIPALSRRICAAFDVDPYGTIASGSLLLSADPSSAQAVLTKLSEHGIAAADIGVIQQGPADVLQQTAAGKLRVKKFERDEITRVFESTS